MCDETATARSCAGRCTRRTCPRWTCARFASRWQLPGPSTGLGVCREMRAETYFQKRAMFFRRSRRARARHCSHHGSSPWLRDAEIFGQGLDEQPCCREHNPRHEQGRARKQQEIVEDSGHHIPHAHGPTLCRRARAAADVMGIPPTLRFTLDVSIGSPPNSLFLDDYVPVRFLTPDVGRVINPVLSARLRDAPRCAHSRHMHSS